MTCGVVVRSLLTIIHCLFFLLNRNCSTKHDKNNIIMVVVEPAVKLIYIKIIIQKKKKCLFINNLLLYDVVVYK